MKRRGPAPSESVFASARWAARASQIVLMDDLSRARSPHPHALGTTPRPGAQELGLPRSDHPDMTEPSCAPTASPSCAPGAAAQGTPSDLYPASDDVLTPRIFAPAAAAGPNGATCSARDGATGVFSPPPERRPYASAGYPATMCAFSVPALASASWSAASGFSRAIAPWCAARCSACQHRPDGAGWRCWRCLSAAALALVQLSLPVRSWLFRFGVLPAVLALSLYSMLPVRRTPSPPAGVEPAILAAQGVGMTQRQSLFYGRVAVCSAPS